MSRHGNHLNPRETGERAEDGGDDQAIAADESIECGCRQGREGSTLGKMSCATVTPVRGWAYYLTSFIRHVLSNPQSCLVAERAGRLFCSIIVW